MARVDRATEVGSLEHTELFERRRTQTDEPGGLDA